MRCLCFLYISVLLRYFRVRVELWIQLIALDGFHTFFISLIHLASNDEQAASEPLTPHSGILTLSGSLIDRKEHRAQTPRSLINICAHFATPSCKQHTLPTPRPAHLTGHAPSNRSRRIQRQPREQSLALHQQSITYVRKHASASHTSINSSRSGHHQSQHCHLR
jgi:hypothetical protein